MEALAGICAMLIAIVCYVGWNIGTIKAQLEVIKEILEGGIKPNE